MMHGVSPKPSLVVSQMVRSSAVQVSPTLSPLVVDHAVARFHIAVAGAGVVGQQLTRCVGHAILVEVTG